MNDCHVPRNNKNKSVSAGVEATDNFRTRNNRKWQKWPRRTKCHRRILRRASFLKLQILKVFIYNVDSHQASPKPMSSLATVSFPKSTLICICTTCCGSGTEADLKSWRFI